MDKINKYLREDIDRDKIVAAVKKISQQNKNNKTYVLWKKFNDAFENLFQHVENDIDRKLASQMDREMIKFTNKFFEEIYDVVKRTRK